MQTLTIEELRDYLADPNTERSGGCSSDVELPFQIKSKSYLEYAENDLNNEYNHHLINALSNTKRAIDSQLDSILYAFGLLEKSRKAKWRFPDKIDLLTKIGIVSPRILKKINQQRNLLEHEFVLPKKESVEDALDVAILFEAYTDKFLHNCLQSFGFSNSQLGSLDLEMDYKNHKIVVTAYGPEY
jgi:hypothetical protein